MRIRFQAAAIVAGLALVSLARANNNFFLPGDAFFPTVLTETDVSRLKADVKPPPVFEYSSLGGYESAFCGYAGYSRARIDGVDQAFVDNLKRAYRHIRKNYESKQLTEAEEDGKKTLRETNGMRLLFYPPEFEFGKFSLGLQYNENWVDEVLKFGHSRHAIRLCCLVNDADGVMESWRDSASVAALKAELPKVELKPVPPVTEPVIIRGPVKAFALDSRPLVRYFKPKENDKDSDVSVLVVDSKGIVELTYRDGTWEKNGSEK